MNRLTFYSINDNKDSPLDIFNENNEKLGWIGKIRVGQWMSWVLYLDEDCYMSAGCLDEVRAKIKELNATANKPSDAFYTKGEKDDTA